MTAPRRRARRAARAPRLALFILLASLRIGWSRDGGEASRGTTSDVADVSDGDFKVVGYLPEYRFGVVDWNATCAGVTHVLLFSLEPTSGGALGALDRFPDAETMRRARDTCEGHGTKLMVSVGGAGRSKHFAAATRSDATRRKLARAIAAFCDAHRLHGVDINWEYPRDEAQWLSVFKLARATRRAFDEIKQISAREEKKNVFLAFHPDGLSERFLAHPLARAHVDLMHCMAYDNARDAEGHSTLAYAEAVVARAVATLHPRRVSLGVPFYGRGVGDRSVADAKAYGDIVGDVAADASDAFAADVLDSYAFNSRATVRAKTALAMASGLGGVTVWELGQDAGGAASLLGAVGSEAWPRGRPRRAPAPAAREEL